LSSARSGDKLIQSWPARVRAAFDEERSLLDVERDLVDRAELDSEGRDALWLYAWSYRDRFKRQPRSRPAPDRGPSFERH
jgi:hypothetical protein